MPNVSNQHQGYSPIGFTSTGAITQFALNTNYVLATSGQCLGLRFVAQATTTITSVLFFVSTAPGVSDNITVQACASNIATQPGGQLANGIVTFLGGTTSGVWLKATFATPPNITQGVVYWIVIGCPNGATNAYTLSDRGTGNNVLMQYEYYCFSSANGFNTAGTTVSIPTPIITVFGDGSQMGQSIIGALTSYTSNTVERGAKYTPDTDMVLMGMTTIGQQAFAAGSVRVYQDPTAPNGTIFPGFNGGVSYTLDASTLVTTMIIFPLCTLRAGVTYRIVYKPSSASVIPSYWPITGYGSMSAGDKAILVAGKPDIHSTFDNGAGGWTDNVDWLPRLLLLFKQYNQGAPVINVQNTMMALPMGVSPY